MKKKISLAAIAIFVVVTSAIMGWHVFRESDSITIKPAATMLFYNSPAAVKLNGLIYVGYTTASGSVEVSVVSGSGDILSVIPVMSYTASDDHSSPALWPVGNKILVATAHHSSDLYLFSIEANTVRQICKWTGHFTYPRFDDTKGVLELYLRQDDGKSGDLVSIDVTTCGEPKLQFKAGNNRYIYAVPPRGKNAWSIYDRTTGETGGAYIDGRSFPLAKSQFNTTRAWSVSGNFFAATRATLALECCGKGQMVTELYDGDQRIYASEVLPTGFYPDGIVLNPNGKEALFPSANGLKRRQVPNVEKMLTSCSGAASFNVSGQYVYGGNGEYVWVGFDKSYTGKKFEKASVHLCIPDRPLEAG